MSECFIAALLEDRPVPPNLRACDGRTDPHHLIRQNRIKQEFPHGVFRVDGGPWRRSAADLRENAPAGEHLPPVALVADARNIVPICRRHHQHVENRRIVIWREDLPAEFHEFARELGLEGWAERYFPRAPEAA